MLNSCTVNRTKLPINFGFSMHIGFIALHGVDFAGWSSGYR